MKKLLNFVLLMGAVNFVHAGLGDALKSAAKAMSDAASSLICSDIYDAAQKAKYNLELRNSSKQQIAVALAGALSGVKDYLVADGKKNFITPAKLGGQNIVVPAEGTFAAVVSSNISDKEVTLWRQVNGNTLSKSEKYFFEGAGKTRYVSYNADNKDGERLYPQSGCGNGTFSSKTSTGLSMAKNISQSEIKISLR